MLTEMDVDLTTPEAQIAQNYMARKGYPELVPFAVEEQGGTPTYYYFYYRLPEGKLELEVSWNSKTGIWDTLVTSFVLTD